MGTTRAENMPVGMDKARSLGEACATCTKPGRTSKFFGAVNVFSIALGDEEVDVESRGVVSIKDQVMAAIKS